MSSQAARRTSPANVQPLVEKWRLFKQTRPEQHGGSYFRNMMVDLPEFVLMIPMGLFAMAWMGYAYKTQIETGYYTNKPYKELYTVMRPDDPRVKLIRSEYYSEDDDFGKSKK